MLVKWWSLVSSTILSEALVNDFLQTFATHREGDGTPLQYSCLENPMDGGARQAAVHGVAEGRTRLSDFTFTFRFHMHWRRKRQPTPVFLPGKSQRLGSLVGCRLWGHTESDTTEVTQQRQLATQCVVLGSQQHQHHLGACQNAESWVCFRLPEPESIGKQDPR